MFQDKQPTTGVFATPLAIRVHIAAKRIGCSTRTVRRYIERGILPAQRIGQRSWSVLVADVEWVRIRRCS